VPTVTQVTSQVTEQIVVPTTTSVTTTEVDQVTSEVVTSKQVPVDVITTKTVVTQDVVQVVQETTVVQVVNKVQRVNVTQESEAICTTGNDNCWLWLLLFIPLLVYLLWRPCSIIRAKRQARFTEPPPVVAAPVVAPKPVMAPIADDEDEDEEAVAEAPPVEPEPEVVAEPVKKGKFKWQIASAENYIWTFQGGARPMYVDKGKHEKSKWRTAHEAIMKKEGGGRAASVAGAPLPPPSVRPVSVARRRQTVVEPRQSSYDEDEIQPGDIDYEPEWISRTTTALQIRPIERPRKLYSRSTRPRIHVRRR
jgi:hypothetical protein